jgi:hypothetical protein
VTVTIDQGESISSRCRERVVGKALRSGFETVALEVKRALRRRLARTAELAA